VSSQVLWFVSRGSGLALLAGFSAVTVLGIAARLGSVPRGWSRLGLGELHRTLALFCVAFLVLHVLTAILDPYVTIGWAATVLPFASPYRATAIGLGAVAVDLGGTVLITSLARRRLGYRAWRAVHWLGYLAWPAAFWHSVTTGTDLRTWWVALVVWGCAAATLTYSDVTYCVAHSGAGIFASGAEDWICALPEAAGCPAHVQPVVRRAIRVATANILTAFAAGWPASTRDRPGN
jgi:methionine sulfoxide reductase heme-binding subunit